MCPSHFSLYKNAFILLYLFKFALINMRTFWNNRFIQLCYGIYVRICFLLYSIAHYWYIRAVEFTLPRSQKRAREELWRLAVSHHNARMLKIAGAHLDIRTEIPEYPHPTIFAANHPSILDGFTFFSMFGPNMIPVTGPAQMFSYPFNKVFPRMGVIDILRDDEDSFHYKKGYTKLAAIHKMITRLHEGKHILLFPEGHLERIPELHYIHTGAARVSIQTGAPVAVAALVGLEKIFIDKIRMRPGKIHVHFGTVLHPPKLSPTLSFHEATRTYRDEMTDELVRLLPPRYIPEYIRTPPLHKIGVFIDIDQTLYKGLSQMDWARFLVKHKLVSGIVVLKIAALVLLEKTHRVTHEHVMHHALGIFKNAHPELVQKLAHAFFEEHARHKIREIMVHLMKDHAEQSHELVLVTEVVRPLALEFKKYFEKEFNIHGVICSELAEKNNRYTGRATRICRGEEKAYSIEEYAHKHEIDLALSYAFADSTSDIEMIQTAGNPIVVCPHRTMRAYAHRHQWKILE